MFEIHANEINKHIKEKGIKGGSSNKKESIFHELAVR